MSADIGNNDSFYAEINDACERFEAEWRSGAQPRIEVYAAQAPEEARPELIRELLKLDIYYRRDRGDTILTADYLPHYAEHTSLIRKLLGLSPGTPVPMDRLPAAWNVPTGPDMGQQNRGEGSLPERGRASTVNHAVRVFGNYELIKELGHGGMGVVHLARQRRPDRLVALKLIRLDRLEQLPADKRQEWLDRFRTEGQATAHIADDHVVPVYEVGVLDGRPFYSMCYVEGHSLADALKTGPFSNTRAATLIESVARAVQAVHDQGVLHRDLKPHNILVDARDRPYVTDFGLAKWLDAADGVTHTGELLGSPPYMSPEQAQDAAHVSEATDIYGLGATLYALLTGSPPFQGKTTAETLHQVKYREPIRPKRLNPSVARDLETITLKCLEKEPRRRFRSATEVADELRRFLEGRPILTRPVRPPERLWRWCRRNPTVASLSAVALILITLAVVIYGAYWSASGKADVASKKVDKLGEEVKKEQHRSNALQYFKDIRHADQALKGSDSMKARELLDRWRAGEGETDHRGWEWNYLDAECKEAAIIRKGHQDEVSRNLATATARRTLHTRGFGAPAWDTKEQALLVLNADLEVRRWHLETGKQEVLLPGRDGNQVVLADWAPDGQRIAVAYRDGTVKVWDMVGSEEPFVLHALTPSPELNPSKNVEALSWSPNGKWLASASTGGVFKVWGTATGKEIFALNSGAGTMHPVLAWSPDSQQLAIGSATSSVTIWSVQGRNDHGFQNSKGSAINAIAWSPDSQHLAALGPFGLEIWEPKTGKESSLLDQSWGGGMSTYSLAWSADGRRLAFSAVGQGAKIVNIVTNKELVTLKANGTTVALAWSPDGHSLATLERSNYSEDKVRIWDANTGREKLALTPANGDDRNWLTGSLTWSADGRQIASGIAVWETATGKKLISQTGLNGRIFWESSGPRLASIKHDVASGTWEATSGKYSRIIGKPWCGKVLIGQVAWTRDGRLVALSQGSSIHVWNVTTRKKVCTIGEVSALWDVQVNSLAFAPDGRRPALGLNQGTVGVVDLTSRQVTHRLPPGERHLSPTATVPLAWSPDGGLLARGGGKGTIEIWETIEGKLRLIMRGQPNDVLALAWHPDGNQLASGQADGTMKIWDTIKGTDERTLRGHVGSLHSLAWSRDGRRLASVGDDPDISVRPGSLKLWDPTSGQELLSWPHVIGPVIWSPGGHRLIAFSDIGGPGVAGGGVTIWDAHPSKER